jgi:hypothetical protein
MPERSKDKLEVRGTFWIGIFSDGWLLLVLEARSRMKSERLYVMAH